MQPNSETFSKKYPANRIFQENGGRGAWLSGLAGVEVDLVGGASGAVSIAGAGDRVGVAVQVLRVGDARAQLAVHVDQQRDFSALAMAASVRACSMRLICAGLGRVRVAMALATSRMPSAFTYQGSSFTAPQAVMDGAA